jgi:hypothetical protein
MNPFGNSDEPDAPSWYLPGRPQWWRTLCWYVRNPMHNLTHYMVGWTNQPFTVIYSAADRDRDGFADAGGWLAAWLSRGSERRPFVSYTSRKMDLYLGWHPVNGKLGARLTLR